ncbi:MAG: DUF4870 domain-containing protein [Micrococcales bacterium]|nr:DUF4870 domain-containing protein [Micrococcales bacterium]NBR62096.1 DUF4870 domain-containing protein [Actinomycetota bacterium]NBR54474.1 DUF4870 domain-containing protein [Micrococcales bacterium]NBT48318.1 DUF4870 domain-containing protein [Actinomycetota bacterium]NBY43713.1 DUF4870 domain-containing protein [Micrococcales bacterium]
MAFCINCQQERTGKFCSVCNRQLVDNTFTSKEMTPAEVYNQSPGLLGFWSHIIPMLGIVVGVWSFIPLLLLWVPGLIIRNLSKATDFDRRHSTESLNFQLTIMLFVVVGLAAGSFRAELVPIVAAPLIIGSTLMNFVLCVIASLRTMKGKEYRYPVNFRFVK